uniref:G protein-coupled receptor n=1 Tax=Bursaphelenchus xylophilus TaxID=6326 RepID=A0A1I7SF18_BURXY
MATNCVDPVNQALIQSVSFSAMLANLVLLWLIRNHTPNPMSSYKKVLYTSSVIDLLSSLSHFSIILRTEMENGITVNSFDGFLPRLLHKMGLVDDANLAYLVLVELAFEYIMLGFCFVPFTYRYFHMVWKFRFTNATFALLVLFYVIPIDLFAFIVAYLAGNTYPHMTQLVSPADPNCVKRMPYYDYKSYPVEPYLTIWSFVRIPILWLNVAPLLQIFFIWRIYKYLNKDMRKSDSYLMMQRQITWTLTGQSVTPLILITVPQFLLGFIYDSGVNTDLFFRTAGGVKRFSWGGQVFPLNIVFH